jgi:hypothetical protein
MNIWTVIDEDERVVRICEELDDVFAAMGVADILPEWPGFFGPNEQPFTSAWPVIADSPFYGKRWFIRLWDPIEENFTMLLAVNEEVYSRKTPF